MLRLFKEWSLRVRKRRRGRSLFAQRNIWTGYRFKLPLSSLSSATLSLGSGCGYRKYFERNSRILCLSVKENLKPPVFKKYLRCPGFLSLKVTIWCNTDISILEKFFFGNVVLLFGRYTRIPFSKFERHGHRGAYIGRYYYCYGRSIPTIHVI